MSRVLPLSLGMGALLLLGAARVCAADSGPSPGFTRHVEAVFSRLGCNGGTCHGAVKGQNGFKLSLFGGDPASDHDRLLREFAGRRLNLLEPDASLLLLKATGQVAHQGGKRMSVGSPEYEILRRWIAAGAAADPPERGPGHPARASRRPSKRSSRDDLPPACRGDLRRRRGRGCDRPLLLRIAGPLGGGRGLQRPGAGRGVRRGGVDRPLPGRAGAGGPAGAAASRPTPSPRSSRTTSSTSTCSPSCAG